MRCPYCQSEDNKVSRVKQGYKVKRTRKCNSCGKRFYTSEEVDVFVLFKDYRKGLGLEDVEI